MATVPREITRCENTVKAITLDLRSWDQHLKDSEGWSKEYRAWITKLPQQAQAGAKQKPDPKKIAAIGKAMADFIRLLAADQKAIKETVAAFGAKRTEITGELQKFTPQKGVMSIPTPMDLKECDALAASWLTLKKRADDTYAKHRKAAMDAFREAQRLDKPPSLDWGSLGKLLR